MQIKLLVILVEVVVVIPEVVSKLLVVLALREALEQVLVQPLELHVGIIVILAVVRIGRRLEIGSVVQARLRATNVEFTFPPTSIVVATARFPRRECECITFGDGMHLVAEATLELLVATCLVSVRFDGLALLV